LRDIILPRYAAIDPLVAGCYSAMQQLTRVMWDVILPRYADKWARAPRYADKWARAMWDADRIVFNFGLRFFTTYEYRHKFKKS